MSVIELLIVSVGLSIDVFVAAVYMGAGFSKIRWKKLILLSILFGGIQLGITGLGQSDHITSIIVHYQDEDSG